MNQRYLQNVDMGFTVENVSQYKNGIVESVIVSIKNQCMKNHYIKDYAWIANTCACECDKDCEIGEYLKHWESIEKFCR